MVYDTLRLARSSRPGEGSYGLVCFLLKQGKTFTGQRGYFCFLMGYCNTIPPQVHSRYMVLQTSPCLQDFVRYIQNVGLKYEHINSIRDCGKHSQPLMIFLMTNKTYLLIFSNIFECVSFFVLLFLKWCSRPSVHNHYIIILYMVFKMSGMHMIPTLYMTVYHQSIFQKTNIVNVHPHSSFTIMQNLFPLHFRSHVLQDPRRWENDGPGASL